MQNEYETCSISDVSVLRIQATEEKKCENVEEKSLELFKKRYVDSSEGGDLCPISSEEEVK